MLPIAAYYFALLGALGIFWPFFSVYLASLGLTPTEVTRVLTLSPLMAMLAPPLTGLIADARRARVWLLRAATAATALAFTGFFVTGGARAAIVVTTGAFSLCRAPLTSLADATALEHARRHGGSYGAIRTWGSIGFIFAVLGGGALLEARGIGWVLPATTVALALAAACAWWMPAPPIEVRPRAWPAWLRLLRARDGWLLLGAVALQQAAGAAYDGCFSLHLGRLGQGPRFVGIAWATGVVAEAILLIFSGRILRQFAATRVFAFSIAVAALRWLLIARVTSPWILLALQPLHGVTFGLFYVSAVTLMRDQAGADAPTAGQGLLAGSFGAGSVIGFAFAGRLLEAGGGRALFHAASLVAAAGAACAFGYQRLRGAAERSIRRAA
ncbi:MAG TPA: MFS transporter [Polyangia bacterium]|nr:MFS transporter [Polyangia bacterium]